MTKIHISLLDKKLREIDLRLKTLWIDDESSADHAEAEETKWEQFVSLLLERVEVIKLYASCGKFLESETVAPAWIDHLLETRKEVRIRQLGIKENSKQIQKGSKKYKKAAERPQIKKTRELEA